MPTDAKHGSGDWINWREFACGWGAAFISIGITYPLNKTIFRQMLHGITFLEALTELRKEGPYYLYRGVLPPLIHKTVQFSLMFGTYGEMRSRLLAAGMGDGTSRVVASQLTACVQALMTPLERVQALLSDASYHKQFKNTFHSFVSLGTQYGFKEYYRGTVPCLLRNGPANLIFFVMKDALEKRMPRSDDQMTDSMNKFIVGSVTGVILSLAVYPVNVVKVAVQTRIGGEYESFIKVLRQIYRERGGKVRNIYYGAFANIARAFLSWGILNAAYELLTQALY